MQPPAATGHSPPDAEMSAPSGRKQITPVESPQKDRTPVWPALRGTATYAKLPTLACGGPWGEAGRASILYDGHPMLVVTRRCVRCAAEKTLYYRVRGGSPPPGPSRG